MLKTFNILVHAPLLDAGQATLCRAGKPIPTETWQRTYMRYRCRENFSVDIPDSVVETIQNIKL
jgi:hypothetical protein